jgi:hypothetical protein
MLVVTRTPLLQSDYFAELQTYSQRYANALAATYSVHFHNAVASAGRTNANRVGGHFP